MRLILAALLLWPCVALADETVTRQNGQKIILKDDHTWIEAQQSGCQHPEKYLELDYRDVDSLPVLDELRAKERPICAVVKANVFPDNKNSMKFYYIRPDNRYDTIKPGQAGAGLDGLISIDGLDVVQRKSIGSQCTTKWCDFVVYGKLTYNTYHIEASSLMPIAGKQ